MSITAVTAVYGNSDSGNAENFKNNFLKSLYICF